MKLFHQVLPATVENVSQLRRGAQRELVNLRVQSDLANDLLLAIAEMATNAVIHADNPPRHIGVGIDLVGASLKIEITDDGSAFANFDAKWEQVKRKDVVASGVSGLGLALAQTLLRDVRYYPGSDGELNRFIGWRPLQRIRPTILIVDDDALTLRLYTSVLKGRYRVLGATSVELASGIARTETIDLIIADYHLGEEFGTSFLNALERDAERLPVPVIMVSADRSVQNRETADGYGIEMFLYKPLTPKNLCDAVEQAMTRSRRRVTSLFRYFGANVERLSAKPDERELGKCGVAIRSAMANAGGGDFILQLKTASGARRFVLADVMGHGLKAKAGAIAFSTMLRSVHAMMPADAGPEALLRMLSNVSRRDAALSDIIATLVIVDQQPDNTYIISAAAHPSPVVVGAHHDYALDASGPLLGIMDDATYTAFHLKLGAGERLVLVTDGVEPKYLAGGGQLPTALVDCIAAAANDPLAAAADAAAEWARGVHGPAPRDDWTIMLLEPPRASH